jgi:hypothetical protein
LVFAGHLQLMNSNDTSKAAFSIPSIIAVIAAILSFKAGAFFGLILAGIAILTGIIGILLSLSPKTRGGIFSSLGVVGGLIGIIAAVVKAVMWFVNG